MVAALNPEVRRPLRLQERHQQPWLGMQGGPEHRSALPFVAGFHRFRSRLEEQLEGSQGSESSRDMERGLGIFVACIDSAFCLREQPGGVRSGRGLYGEACKRSWMVAGELMAPWRGVARCRLTTLGSA